MEELFTPEFWDRKWIEFKVKNATYRGQKKDAEEYWNQRAEGFANSTIKSDSRQERTRDVFSFLEFFGIIKTDMTVLDIGSGPGSFAIPLAEQGARVVALDPASRMLEILQENLPPSTPGSVDCVQALWEDYDVEKQGWENKFDLVFASMSPGVNNLETLQKMMFCSRRWCYLSGFSGSRNYSLYNEVFKQITGEPYINHFNDIIFPFNLLYTLGCEPGIKLSSSSNQLNQKVTDFRKEIYEILENRELLNTEAESVVEQLINRHASQGSIRQEVSSRVGMIIWQVVKD
ncbi:class I SAM-dependent methyltransferase [Syntrophomonas wolfei]|jgi:ubiquinone/menaquinone biosynthesis C-methylase UbiE|uniref:class I SAM-dependent methyltransferase n=2 Tax=Syntrophomonas wolfei TaxID=863 RepID=UPI0023F05B53|nr:class I SAM-dependent methyltransferase [Syntrophomonas wolfei]